MSTLRTWLAATALLIVANPADAGGWSGHVAAGGGTSIAGKNVLVGSAGAERGIDRMLYGGALSFDLSLLSMTGRHDTGRRLDADVQALAAGLRWRRNGWLLGFSPALATARTDAISSVVQFLSTAGYEWGRFGVYLQHLSNASTHGDNLGETMLMAEVRFGGAPR